MKAFILLSLACLAVSLPIHLGTGQADLDLPDSVYKSVNEENAYPLPPQPLPVTQPCSEGGDPESCSVASCPVSPTAAAPSNVALFRRRRPRLWLSRVWRSRPKRLPPRVKPSKILSEEPSKEPSDPTSLLAPIAATPSNATLFQRRGLGVMLSPYRHYRFRPRVKPSKTPSEEPSKDHLALADPASLPAPTAALFKRGALGVMLKPWLMYHRPYRRPSRVKPSKTLSEEPSKEP